MSKTICPFFYGKFFLDKCFLRVYHPTRKGKGVFEKKFSETLFFVYCEKQIPFEPKGMDVFYVRETVSGRIFRPFQVQEE